MMSARETGTQALAFDNVSCTFPARGRARETYTAVRETSLTIADGEFVSLVGPTGCGKSTLLNVAAGLLAPTQGQVRVLGQRLHGLNHEAGYLFQADALFRRTALDNVMAGLEFRSVPRDAARESAMQWLNEAEAHAPYPHELGYA
jgi:NitT/TauT family transport system ATP-binding protein